MFPIQNKKKAIWASCAAAASFAVYGLYKIFGSGDEIDPTRVKYPPVNPSSLTPLDLRIYELSQEYQTKAAALLEELISFPDSDRHVLQDDPDCGTSNHEQLRLHFLQQRIIDLGAVSNKSDINFDDFGNLVWQVTDPHDQTPLSDRKVIYLDARSDCYPAENDQWKKILGSGIDAFHGMSNPSLVNTKTLKALLGFIPKEELWEHHLLFGRGSADQLQGIVSAVFITKILLETISMNSLKGCIVIAIASVSGLENPGVSISNRFSQQNIPRWQIPDCVVLLQSTGDIEAGPCGIYIGQQGHCQIEVDVSGYDYDIINNNIQNQPKTPKRSTMSALEHATFIIAEAEAKGKQQFKNTTFMGPASRNVLFTHSEITTDPMVPSHFTFRFDRTTTHGELWDQLINEICCLKSVQQARADNMKVKITVPRYSSPSWRGVKVDNQIDYPAWVTHPESPAIKVVVETYKRMVSPHIPEFDPKKHSVHDTIPPNPRISRYLRATDGVGYLLTRDQYHLKNHNKLWMASGKSVFPPMFGIGAGYEQHAGKIGEYVIKDHLWVPIAVGARFPSLFVNQSK